MKLTTVREIYKDREKYLDQEVTVGGMVSQCTWLQGFWIYRTSRWNIL